VVWDTKHRKCLILPDPASPNTYALAKADRYQEAIDALDMLDNPNTPRALSYRGYATRKLGRTGEGIGYYLKSVALDPKYSQAGEYLGKPVFSRASTTKIATATIEKFCGKDCEYYEDLVGALTEAHAL
jgi:tetratricopeptide (TPR) repeat protein